MNIQFKIDGDAKKIVRDALSRSPLEIKKAVAEATLLVWSKTNAETPTWRGELRRATSYSVSGFRGIVANRMKYAMAVHEGTKPHGVPKSVWSDPNSSFSRWAKEHGIPPFVLARSIRKKGTRKQPWMRDVFDTEKARILKIFTDAAEKIIKK